MSDLCRKASKDEPRDVIDITEDEDTIPYWTKENNDFEAADEDTVAMLSPLPPTQQAFSPKPTSIANMPPPSCTEDPDVIYMPNKIDVVVIEDDNDSVIPEDKESTTNAPNSHLYPDKLQQAKLNSGTPGSAAGASLRSPPSSPYSKDNKDSVFNLLQLKIEEVAKSLKFEEILSTEPAAMVVIPTTEIKIDEDLECYDLTEEDEEALLCSPPPNNNLLHEAIVKIEPSLSYSTYGENHNSSTSNLASTRSGADDPLEGPSTRSGADDPLEGPSTRSGADDPLEGTSSRPGVEDPLEGPSTRPGVEDPLEGPSTRFDNDSRPNMDLSCPNLSLQPAPPQNLTTHYDLPSTHPAEETSRNLQLPETLLNNVPSPNLILSLMHSTSEASKHIESLLAHFNNKTSLTEKSPACLTEQVSSNDEPSTTMDISLILPEEVSVRTPQSSCPPAFSTDEAPSTLVSLPNLSSNKTSIFDDPKLYRFHYQKWSPETRNHFDKICILRQKIINTLNKYSFDDVTEPEVDRTNATLNVENDEICKLNEDITEKTEEVSLNGNLNKGQESKIREKIDRGMDRDSIAVIQNNLIKCGTEMFPAKTLDHETSQINFDPGMPNPSNEPTPKKSCLPNNTTPKQKKTVKFKVESKDKENQNIFKSRKRSSHVISTNNSTINDDNTPGSKCIKKDKNSPEQSQQSNIAANKDVVSCGINPPKLTERGSFYVGNKQEDPTKMTRTQKPLKHNKIGKRIKTNATDANNFNEYDERKHFEFNSLPSSSKQEYKNIKKISPPKTISDDDGRQFKAEQPITTITLKIECGIQNIGENHQALITSNSVPDRYQNSGMSTSNNMSYPIGYSASTPNPNFQCQRLDAQKDRSAKTKPEWTPKAHYDPFKLYENTRPNNYRPKPSPRNAINPYIDMMNLSSLANLRGYPWGTSPASNIRDPSRHQQNNYMTVNGIPPTAHSNAVSLRIDEMRQNVNLFPCLYMPSQLQSPPHYKPPQPH